MDLSFEEENMGQVFVLHPNGYVSDRRDRFAETRVIVRYHGIWDLGGKRWKEQAE